MGITFNGTSLGYDAYFNETKLQNISVGNTNIWQAKQPIPISRFNPLDNMSSQYKGVIASTLVGGTDDNCLYLITIEATSSSGTTLERWGSNIRLKIYKWNNSSWTTKKTITVGTGNDNYLDILALYGNRSGSSQYTRLYTTSNLYISAISYDDIIAFFVADAANYMYRRGNTIYTNTYGNAGTSVILYNTVSNNYAKLNLTFRGEQNAHYTESWYYIPQALGIGQLSRYKSTYGLRFYGVQIRETGRSTNANYQYTEWDTDTTPGYGLVIPYSVISNFNTDNATISIQNNSSVPNAIYISPSANKTLNASCMPSYSTQEFSLLTTSGSKYYLYSNNSWTEKNISNTSGDSYTTTQFSNLSRYGGYEYIYKNTGIYNTSMVKSYDTISNNVSDYRYTRWRNNGKFNRFVAWERSTGYFYELVDGSWLKYE